MLSKVGMLSIAQASIQSDRTSIYIGTATFFHGNKGNMQALSYDVALEICFVEFDTYSASKWNTAQYAAPLGVYVDSIVTILKRAARSVRMNFRVV